MKAYCIFRFVESVIALTWILACSELVEFSLRKQNLYERYEAQAGLSRRTMKARVLWDAILESQVETGTPYMLYKDACNFKSNQKNLGTIKSSNLCTEIVEYTAPDEVCTRYGVLHLNTPYFDCASPSMSSQ